MNYRRLTLTELKDLEQEFIQFLVANGIDVDQWQTIQKERPQEMETWVDGFSKVVFEKVLENAQYLEFFSTSEVRLYHCLDEKMEAIFIRSKAIDLNSPEGVQQALSNSGQAEFFKGSKAYSKARKTELFELLEAGYLITKGLLFQSLEKVVQ